MAPFAVTGIFAGMNAGCFIGLKFKPFVNAINILQKLAEATPRPTKKEKVKLAMLKMQLDAIEAIEGSMPVTYSGARRLMEVTHRRHGGKTPDEIWESIGYNLSDPDARFRSVPPLRWQE